MSTAPITPADAPRWVSCARRALLLLVVLLFLAFITCVGAYHPIGWLNEWLVEQNEKDMEMEAEQSSARWPMHRQPPAHARDLKAQAPGERALSRLAG